jgi:hypothetical protein
VKTAGSASETGVDPGNLHESVIKILSFSGYQSRCESNHGPALPAIDFRQPDARVRRIGRSLA